MAQSLALLLPYSRAFLAQLASADRLAALTHGAVAEQLAASSTPATPSSSALAPTTPTPAPATAVGLATEPAACPLATIPSSTSEATLCPPLSRCGSGESCLGAAGSQEEGEGWEQLRAAEPFSSSAAKAGVGAEATGCGACQAEAGLDSAAAPGEGQLQRGVSVIPEAIVRLEQEQQVAQQAQQAQQQECSQQEQQQQQQQPAPKAATEPGGQAAAPAPFTSALRRLLAAWVAERSGAVTAAAAGAGAKRSREGEGAAEAAQQAKRARFAFRREDVGVARYDTLTFLVGGRPFPAVGFVLEAHSPLLRSLLGTLRGLDEALPVPCVAGFGPDRCGPEGKRSAVRRAATSTPAPLSASA